MKVDIKIDSAEDVIPHMSKGMPPSTGIIQDAIRKIGVRGVRLTKSGEKRAVVEIPDDFGRTAAMQYATVIKNDLSRRFGVDKVSATISIEELVP